MAQAQVHESAQPGQAGERHQRLAQFHETREQGTDARPENGFVCLRMKGGRHFADQVA